MKRTSAAGSVSGLYVDRNPGTSTAGTAIVESDMNMHQEELANAVEKAGLTLSAVDDEQLYKAIRAMSHGVGEFVFNARKLSPSVDWPAVRIDDADVTLASANYPQLVTALYAEPLTAAGVSAHACTIAGSVITFPSTTAAIALLAALYDDYLVHGGGQETGSYTNWLSLTVGSTNYAITNINTATRAVTVTGTPASGAQTVTCYGFRIAGSSTTVRIYKNAGRALMAQGDTDNTLVAGLRRRDRGQGHRHQNHRSASGSDSSYYGLGAANGSTTLYAVENPVSDGVNGEPRTGKWNETRGMAAYMYMWAGVYVA